MEGKPKELTGQIKIGSEVSREEQSLKTHPLSGRQMVAERENSGKMVSYNGPEKEECP